MLSKKPIVLIGSLFLLFITLFLYPLVSIGKTADIQVNAELNLAEFPLDQAAFLTVTVHGAGSATVAPPSGDDLEFIHRGESSKSQWINGKSTSSVSFMYLVAGKKTGTHTIEPITITVDNTTYTTQSISCTVLPAKSAAKPSTSTAAKQSSAGNGTTARLRSGKSEQVGFMRIMPGKKSIYCGELIPFTITAYFRPGMRVDIRSNPKFTGKNFLIHSIDSKPRQYEERVNNEIYITLTWKGTLSAVREGQFPLEVEMDATLLVRARQNRLANGQGSPFFTDPFFDDFFARYTRRNVTIVSPEKTITVKNLPADKRPETFNGAIGTFSLAVTASPLHTKTGNPVTLKMNISGNGNFDTVGMPEITDTTGWKTYPATDSFVEKTPLSGTKTFERALIPTDPGIKAIPPIEFSYFDPDAEEYVTLNSDPIALDISIPQQEVDQAEHSEPVQQMPQEDQQLTSPDVTQKHLAPLHNDPGLMVPVIVPLFRKPWFLAMTGGAVLALLAALLFKVRKNWRQNNPEILRKRQLHRELLYHFKEIDTAIDHKDQDSFIKNCRQAIQKHLAIGGNIQPQAMTSADILQILPAGHPLVQVFTTIEQTEYSGGRLQPDTMRDMSTTIKNQLAEK